jgi:hypothetical protein
MFVNYAQYCLQKKQKNTPQAIKTCTLLGTLARKYTDNASVESADFTMSPNSSLHSSYKKNKVYTNLIHVNIQPTCII